MSELERLVGARGAPEFIRCDNGPELTAHAVRDWCRFSGAGTAFIDPGSPWQNPYVESFNSRLRDELLDVEEFATLVEAKVLIADWQDDYNHRRPHSSLGWRSPVTFAAAHVATLPPATGTAAGEVAEHDPRTAPTIPVEQPGFHHGPELQNQAEEVTLK